MSGLLVVAIDFGTTYSGYAFSFKSDYKINKLSISCQNFITPGANEQHVKVPTTVLFTPDQNFHSFGYEAENHFSSMIEHNPKEATNWFYFERFKMKLHKNQTLERQTILMDYTQKKKMPAMKVFSSAIRHFKDHLKKSLKDKEILVRETEIDWVLTVPAIWSDKARQFMREAAKEAGIPDQQLSLALEPEAASILCLEEDTQGSKFDISGTGKKFMVVDCGGGTIDVTAYEVCQGGRLKEICPPRGGSNAGTKVDETFKTYLMSTFGFDAITAFNKLELLDLFRDFEHSKRFFCDDSPDKIVVKLPSSVAESLTCELRKKTELEQQVQIVSSRIFISKSKFDDFFSSSIECVIQEIKSVIHQPTCKGLHTILLVGGFSQCTTLRSSVAKEFPDFTTIVPKDPAAAILKGAVIFRHNPAVIGWRASAYTYGISTYEIFDANAHDPAKKCSIDGKEVCKDVFTSFIHVNDIVAVGHVATRKTLYPVRSDQRSLVLPIYKSPSSDPVYVTDAGCEKIGEGVVTLGGVAGDESLMLSSFFWRTEREVEVSMVVGGVELIINATDRSSQKKFSTKCDFLSK